MSIHPQLGTQLGKDSHSCSYCGGSVVTSVPSRGNAQVMCHRTGSDSPHPVDNPGGGAPCRPVDEAIRCAQCPQPTPRCCPCPDLVSDLRPRRAAPAYDRGPRPQRGRGPRATALVQEGPFFSASAST